MLIDIERNSQRGTHFASCECLIPAGLGLRFGEEISQGLKIILQLAVQSIPEADAVERVCDVIEGIFPAFLVDRELNHGFERGFRYGTAGGTQAVRQPRENREIVADPFHHTLHDPVRNDLARKILVAIAIETERSVVAALLIGITTPFAGVIDVAVGRAGFAGIQVTRILVISKAASNDDVAMEDHHALFDVRRDAHAAANIDGVPVRIFAGHQNLVDAVRRFHDPGQRLRAHGEGDVFQCNDRFRPKNLIESSFFVAKHGTPPINRGPCSPVGNVAPQGIDDSDTRQWQVITQTSSRPRTPEKTRNPYVRGL